MKDVVAKIGFTSFLFQHAAITIPEQEVDICNFILAFMDDLVSSFTSQRL